MALIITYEYSFSVYELVEYEEFSQVLNVFNKHRCVLIDDLN